MAQWEIVIGLETHVQLTTQSKIFSGSSTAFGAAPNTQAAIVDLALPGALPVMNRGAVERAEGEESGEPERQRDHRRENRVDAHPSRGAGEEMCSGRGPGLRREDRKSTRLNSSHLKLSRMPSSA